MKFQIKTRQLVESLESPSGFAMRTLTVHTVEPKGLVKSASASLLLQAKKVCAGADTYLELSALSDNGESSEVLATTIAMWQENDLAFKAGMLGACPLGQVSARIRASHLTGTTYNVNVTVTLPDTENETIKASRAEVKPVAQELSWARSQGKRVRELRAVTANTLVAEFEAQVADRIDNVKAR